MAVRYYQDADKKYAFYRHTFDYGYKKSTWKPSTNYVVYRDAFQDRKINEMIWYLRLI
jgi:hypothetical protein